MLNKRWITSVTCGMLSSFCFKAVFWAIWRILSSPFTVPNDKILQNRSNNGRPFIKTGETWAILHKSGTIPVEKGALNIISRGVDIACLIAFKIVTGMLLVSVLNNRSDVPCMWAVRMLSQQRMWLTNPSAPLLPFRVRTDRYGQISIVKFRK